MQREHVKDANYNFQNYTEGAINEMQAPSAMSGVCSGASSIFRKNITKRNQKPLAQNYGS